MESNFKAHGLTYVAKSGTVVEFIENNINSDYKRTQDTKTEYVYWGKRNDSPKRIRDLTLANHIAPGLLAFKIAATIGKGIITYESVYEGDKEIKTPIEDNEVYDFLNENGFGEEDHSKLAELVTDLHWFESGFAQFIMNQAKTKVAKLSNLEAYYTRSGKRNENGDVGNIYFGDFYNAKVKDFTPIPLYNPSLSEIPDKFAIHLKVPTPGFLYYPPATWHSSELWMKVSNAIPLFKASGMENDMVVKNHVKIPANYFALQAPDNAEEQKKIEKDFYAQLDEFLVGEQNTRKSITTFYPVDPITGKELAGVQIIPIEDKTNYEAHLTDDERATSAICSAHNINPTLANILINNKLSSGSEIRNAFEIYTGLYSYTFRQLAVKPLYIVKRINKWNPKIKFGFRDIKLETLDINPTGSTNAL